MKESHIQLISYKRVLAKVILNGSDINLSTSIQVDMHGILKDIKINKVHQIESLYSQAELNAKKNN